MIMSETVTQFIIALVGCSAVAGPIGAWLGSRLTAEKYRVEVERLRAEVRHQVADACSSELDNVRKSNDMLADVCTQLKKETDKLRKDVDKLRKAVEKIPSCPYSADCPVNRQLLSDEEGKAGGCEAK